MGTLGGKFLLSKLQGESLPEVAPLIRESTTVQGASRADGSRPRNTTDGTGPDWGLRAENTMRRERGALGNRVTRGGNGPRGTDRDARAGSRP